jgi:hypothetical protein
MARYVAMLVLAGTAVALSNGCDLGPKEGDPCNALLLHDECDDGLQCQTIGSCTVTYCCPANASSSRDAHCNGTACPPVPDAGPDEAGADAGSD